MKDSWRPRKLEPGLAAQYSIPRDLKTSVMKSEPGRELLVTSTVAPVSGFKAACCASAMGAVAARPAAPAAPFRKPRRSTGFFAFSSICASCLGRPGVGHLLLCHAPLSAMLDVQAVCVLTQRPVPDSGCNETERDQD